MKVVMVGDTRVGKTCVLEKLTSGIFKESSPPTIGAAFKSHILETKEGCVSLQIWDTAGQEKYRALTQMYYRSANVALLFFDLTNRDSFNALELWCGELSRKAPEKIKTVLVGNKLDLIEERVVSKDDAEKFANEHNIFFYAETSAKTGEGITDLFVRIAENIICDEMPTQSLDLDSDNSPSNNCC